MTSFPKISDIIDNVNNSQSIQFRLETLDEYKLLPYSNKKDNVIFYGDNTEVYLALYNWGTKELCRKFFLQNVFAENRYYKEALSLLNEVNSIYSQQQLNIKKHFSKECYKILYQSLFVVFHEMGHCVLNSHDDIRMTYYDAIKKDFYYLYGTDETHNIVESGYKDNAPWYLRVIAKLLGINLKGQLEDMLNKNEKFLKLYIEEFACDYYSADMFFKLNNQKKCFTDKQMQMICSSIIDMQSCVAENDYMKRYVTLKEKIPRNIIPYMALRRSMLFGRLYDVLQNEYDKYLKNFEKDCANNSAKFKDYFMLSRSLGPYADFLEQGSNFDFEMTDKESYDLQSKLFGDRVLSDIIHS